VGLNKNGWLRKKSNICVALHPSSLRRTIVRLIPQDLRRPYFKPGLNFLLCHPKLTF